MPAQNVVKTERVPDYTGRSAGVRVDPSSGELKINPDGTERVLLDTATTQSAAGKTITGLFPREVVTATNVITAAESGTIFFLASATEFVSTLPAVASAGAWFRFIVSAAPSGASYTVVTATGTTIVGQITTNDVNSATDSGFSATGVATITFVDAKAVKGDWVEVISDGTNWYVTGACSVFDAITLS